jgi:dephospho-CoA kinase
VLSDYEKRIARIVARDNITQDSARARINSQPDDEFYISRCEYVVYNNSTEEELFSQIERVMGGNNAV